ncbi:hypothetical protein GL307_21225 [Nocardia seriolae]|uniref:hypothetical protein n=1 Tax=Nocardia seriolae TaxID=37332 RepID=UPI0012BD68B0|nr:hypothetical protein [Nocardia seriolae]MTL13993.1 hypothetical protein [Nocardia seriolae]
MLYDSQHHRGATPAARVEELLEQSSFGSPGAAAVRAGIPAPRGHAPARRARYLAHGLDPHLQRHYAGRLHISEQAMQSVHTPEFAYRVPGAADDADWQLSWLPERRFTRGQALLGMILDTTPAHPAAPGTGPAHTVETAETAQAGSVGAAVTGSAGAQQHSWTWQVALSVVALVGMCFVFVCALIVLGVTAGQAGAVSVAVVAGVVACVVPGRERSLARRVARALSALTDRGCGN